MSEWFLFCRKVSEFTPTSQRQYSRRCHSKDATRKMEQPEEVQQHARPELGLKRLLALSMMTVSREYVG
jgi:hypothetical protein